MKQFWVGKGNNQVLPSVFSQKRKQSHEKLCPTRETAYSQTSQASKGTRYTPSALFCPFTSSQCLRRANWFSVSLADIPNFSAISSFFAPPRETIKS
jgi:hypothetical protein